MQSQMAVQKTLRTKLNELQSQNPRFSLRAFSRRVGIQPGALSAILNGRRAVSRKMALRIAHNLMLDPQERSELVTAFQARQAEPSQDPAYLRLSAAQYKILAQWEHFALLSLMNTADFSSDPEWIAGRLGLPQSQVVAAIARLVEVGLLKSTPKGKLTRTKIGLRTSDDIADLSVRKFHDQTLELAKESLHRDAVEARDFSATTFAIDPTKLGEAKALVRKFQDDLAALVESGHQTEVYRFSCQLFPLTVLKGPRK